MRRGQLTQTFPSRNVFSFRLNLGVGLLGLGLVDWVRVTNQQVGVVTYLDWRQVDVVPVLGDDINLLCRLRVHVAPRSRSVGLCAVHWEAIQSHAASARRCVCESPTDTRLRRDAVGVLIIIRRVWPDDGDRHRSCANLFDSPKFRFADIPTNFAIFDLCVWCRWWIRRTTLLARL